MATYLYSDMIKNNGRTVLKNENHSVILNEVEFKAIKIDITEYMYQNFFFSSEYQMLA